MCPYVTIGIFRFSTYTLMTLLGMGATFLYTAIVCKYRKIKYENEIIYLCFAFAFSAICAMLLFQLTYLQNNIDAISHIFDDFAYTQEHFYFGMVYYGGLIGIFVGFFVYTRFFHADTRMMLQISTPAIPLFHVFGRIGCLLTGCCHGSENLLYGVYHVKDQTYYLPTQAYESGGNLILFIVLAILARKEQRIYRLLGLYFTSYGMMRFVLEFFRGDAERGFIGALSTSQFISLFIIPLGIYCLFCPEDKNFFNYLFTAKFESQKAVSDIKPDMP